MRHNARLATTLSYIGVGVILFSSSTPICAQVNLPPGFEALDIVADEEYTGRPSINNCGEIVFHKQENSEPHDGEVYLYDNGHIIRITDNDESDDNPRINDMGEIAWERYIYSRDRMEVVFLRDGVETVVDESWRVTGLNINNLGHLAWSEFRDGECYTWETVVLFWDSVNVTQITPDSRFYNMSPALNDFDDLVWTHMDVCANPWQGHIQGYWDQQIVDLPTVSSQDQGPDISDDRHVSWSPADAAVLWRDGEIIFVAPDGTGAVSLNERDELFTIIWDEARDLWRPWFIRARGERLRAFKLSDENRRWGVGGLNDYGESVCHWRYPREHGGYGGGIFFLRRARTGDADFDGHIELGDARRLTKCLTGPGRVDGLCDCRFLDIDHDGDVDLADYSAFQNAFQPG